MTTPGRTTKAAFRSARSGESVRWQSPCREHVYYRGEEIEGTIQAAFYNGAPLVGGEVVYRLADDRQHTATTDERGEVHFKLPTREFSETQLLAFQVTMPERNVATAVNFMLAAQGFSIDVHTVRPVYLAGETFEVAVNTRDAEGKPMAQDLRLKVFEQTKSAHRVGERLVEEHPLKTAANGAARKTLKLPAGGNYVLRIEGIDRFHAAISGQCGCRSPAMRIPCGCASWPTLIATASAMLRVRVHCARSRRLGWSRFKGPRCWTIGSSN